jgi:hypothetical protein
MIIFKNLLAGKPAVRRRNFFDGKGGIPTEEFLVLEPHQFIVIEGILALHDEFIKLIGSHEKNLIKFFIRN